MKVGGRNTDLQITTIITDENQPATKTIKQAVRIRTNTPKVCHAMLHQKKREKKKRESRNFTNLKPIIDKGLILPN